jgi:hypothetical protein
MWTELQFTKDKITITKFYHEFVAPPLEGRYVYVHPIIGKEGFIEGKVISVYTVYMTADRILHNVIIA